MNASSLCLISGELGWVARRSPRDSIQLLKPGSCKLNPSSHLRWQTYDECLATNLKQPSHLQAMYMSGRLAATAARPLARYPASLRPSLMCGVMAWSRTNHEALRQATGCRKWESTISAPPVDPVAPAAEDATQNTIAEEKDTGHFEVKENEALLFFDSM